MKSWPPERVAQLRLLWGAGHRIARIAYELGVTEYTVKYQARLHRLPRRWEPWPAADVDELRRRWSAGESVATIAGALGRTEPGVDRKARQIGLKCPRPTWWTEERQAELRRLWAEGVATPAIGRRLGTTKNAVISKAHQLELEPRQMGGRPGLARPFVVSLTPQLHVPLTAMPPGAPPELVAYYERLVA